MREGRHPGAVMAELVPDQRVEFHIGQRPQRDRRQAERVRGRQQPAGAHHDRPHGHVRPGFQAEDDPRRRRGAEPRRHALHARMQLRHPLGRDDHAVTPDDARAGANPAYHEGDRSAQDQRRCEQHDDGHERRIGQGRTCAGEGDRDCGQRQHDPLADEQRGRHQRPALHGAPTSAPAHAAAAASSRVRSGGGHQGDERPADESQRQSEVHGERTGASRRMKAEKSGARNRLAPTNIRKRCSSVRRLCGAGVGRNGRDARPGRCGAGRSHGRQPRDTRRRRGQRARRRCRHQTPAHPRTRASSPDRPAVRTSTVQPAQPPTAQAMNSSSDT